MTIGLFSLDYVRTFQESFECSTAAAKTEMSEQPLVHTSQTGLHGYSLAVTTNKHLQLDLPFTKLNKTNHSLIPYVLYLAPDILLPLHCLVAFCIFKKAMG